LILAFLYFNATPHAGPGPKDLNLLKTGLFSLSLFTSSFTLWRAEIGQRRGNPRAMIGWLALTIVLGGVFMIGQGLEYWGLFKSGVTVSANLFATTFFTLTGFHGFHVGLGLAALLIVLALAAAGDFKKGRAVALGSVSLYWHFVDAIWVLVFSVVYLFPFLK